jgi:hypothetical protein
MALLERVDYVEGRASSVSQKLRMVRKDYSREGTRLGLAAKLLRCDLL